MSDGKRIRILIADDHPVVRHGLVALLKNWKDLHLVGEASTGKEAVALYRQYQPDIILLDLRMPEIDGIETIMAIRKQFPTARIIVLTTYDDDEDIHRAFQAGAAAYLLKDVPPEELIATIRAVHAGQTRIPPPIAAKLAEHMRMPILTPRELEVLCLLVTGKSNKEIGAALGISPRTAKIHLSHILDKLDASDRTQAVSIALQRGLVRLD